MVLQRVFFILKKGSPANLVKKVILDCKEEVSLDRREEVILDCKEEVFLEHCEEVFLPR